MSAHICGRFLFLVCSVGDNAKFENILEVLSVLGSPGFRILKNILRVMKDENEKEED